MEKQFCCGCTACVHSCPVHCISMQEDQEGFLYPTVDEARCIHCNKCREVCPIARPLIPHGTTSTYVGYAKDQYTRRDSSSGGVFSLIAEWIFNRNGVVFGAAFDENLTVRHVCAETPTELCLLRGSKYVQSNLGNTFAEVKKHLAEGRWVLFSGTACQIAGLKKHLEKDYDHLLTIDLLCHGVPSPKVWKLYLEDQTQKNKSGVTAVWFRDKRIGWKQYSVTLQFENGNICSRLFSDDSFMNMFLGNIDLRPSCHDCQFKTFPRVSDLTIGDCWGVENVMPEMDDDKGTSVILVHTDKGQAVLNEIQEVMRLKKAELEVVLPDSMGVQKSVAMHPNRKKFMKGLQRGEPFGVLHGYVQKSFLQKVIGLMRYTVLWKR